MSSEDEQPRRIMLTEFELSVLLRGGEVPRDGVVVGLQDVGLQQIATIVETAKLDVGKPMPWEEDPEGWAEVMESATRAINGEF